MIIHVGDPPSEDLCDFKILAKVGQSAVKRHNVDRVPSLLEMRDYFFGARRVARAFAVDSVKNGRHLDLAEYIVRQQQRMTIPFPEALPPRGYPIAFHFRLARVCPDTLCLA